MAYNEEALNSVLTDMKATFEEDPNKAVRGQNFIKQLHDYCIEELKARGFTGDLEPEKEVKILTSHKYKDVDVAVIHPTSGPLLAIGVRSQMSSLSKNFINYFEMEVGDVTGIHERYPLCVVGLLYLHPTQPILPGSESQTFNFDRAEKMFNQITERERGGDQYGEYEEVAYIRANFHEDPVSVDQSFPTLDNVRIDEFFDKLHKKFMERNYYL